MARCVECGREAERLLRAPPPAPPELALCKHCGRVVDTYLEYEPLLIIIDLILHRQQAYYHTIFNHFVIRPQEAKKLLWWSVCALVVMDACRQPVLNLAEWERRWSTSQFDIGLAAVKVIAASILSNTLFAITLVLALSFSGALSKAHSLPLEKGIVLRAIPLSSFFKLLLIPMMVWRFSPGMVFIINFFVFTSNTVAVQAASERSFLSAVLSLAVAVLFKAVAGRVLLAAFLV